MRNRRERATRKDNKWKKEKYCLSYWYHISLLIDAGWADYRSIKSFSKKTKRRRNLQRKAQRKIWAQKTYLCYPLKLLTILRILVFNIFILLFRQYYATRFNSINTNFFLNVRYNDSYTLKITLFDGSRLQLRQYVS